MPQSNPVKTSRKCVRRSLVAVFRQTFWPIFDQKFGRFSTKVLVGFRPKPWPISDQKTLNWIAPMGLGERPSDATLALAIFFGKPSQFSRGAFPNLRAKPFNFLRKLKSESKSGHDFWSKSGQRNSMPRRPDCEPARNLCYLWPFFDPIFCPVFGHDFVPQTGNQNRKTTRPKSENGQAEFGKRAPEFSENEKAKIQK